MSNAKAVGLAFLIIIVVFAGVIGEALIERANSPEPVAKPEYIYKDIVTKHGDSFRIQSNMFEEIKKSVATSKNMVIRKNIEAKTEERCSDDEYQEDSEHPLYLREIFYDKNGREVYRIDDKKKADTNGSIRGYRETPYYPNEIGYVYGSNGKIVKEFKSLLSSSTYTLMGNRKSMYKNTPVWNIETKEYEYDSNNLLTKERRIKFIYSVQSYESSEKEYESGKLKKEKIVMDDEYPASNTSLIYVEITKEYDENEKLIKKFVLRKNKFNAVRSETNFDFIKGEIVTKYYDGEKAFATVTETLIGKDRAIVKRERVGDEFVIWDLVTYGKKVNNAPEFISDVYDRYIINNNKVETVYIEILEHEHGYNNTANKPNGIDMESYLDERVSNCLDENFGVTSSYQVSNIILSRDKKYISYFIKEKIPVDLELRKIRINIEDMKEYIIKEVELKEIDFDINLIIKKFKEDN